MVGTQRHWYCNTEIIGYRITLGIVNETYGVLIVNCVCAETAPAKRARENKANFIVNTQGRRTSLGMMHKGEGKGAALPSAAVLYISVCNRLRQPYQSVQHYFHLRVYLCINNMYLNFPPESISTSCINHSWWYFLLFSLSVHS